MRDIELRLDGHGGPSGELRADRAASIAAALDELVLRLTRHAASAPGLGRPGIPIERLGEVRLAGISPGSTCLLFRVGDASALDIDPLGEEADAMFWDIAQGIANNCRPEFVTATIAAATQRFVGAMVSTAATVTIAVGTRQPVLITTAQADRTIWEPADSAIGPATLAGKLEAVDLRSAHFRIVDDVGNRIELHDVQDSADVAALVNHRVLAEGLYTPATASSRARLDGVTIRPFELPAELTEAAEPPAPDLATGALAVSAMPADLALSEDELEAFLATIHG